MHFYEKIITRKLVDIRYLILILGQVCLITFLPWWSYIYTMQSGGHEPHVSVEHLNVAIVTKELNFKSYLL